MRAFQLILAAFSLVIFHLGNAAADTNIERKIQIVNDTGHKVEIFWVHPYTQEMVLQTQPHIYTGTTFDLNSFVGHSFQANELPGKKTGACAEESCKTAFFTVSENEDQGENINSYFI